MEQPSAHKMDLSRDHRHPSKACTGTYLLLVAPCIINTQGLGLYLYLGFDLYVLTYINPECQSWSVWQKGWTCSGCGVGRGRGLEGVNGLVEKAKSTHVCRCIHDD